MKRTRRTEKVELIHIAAQVEKTLQREIKKWSFELDIPASEFIRLAVKEKIERMKEEKAFNIKRNLINAE
jgi:hypothetical protein